MNEIIKKMNENGVYLLSTTIREDVPKNYKPFNIIVAIGKKLEENIFVFDQKTIAKIMLDETTKSIIKSKNFIEIFWLDTKTNVKIMKFEAVDYYVIIQSNFNQDSFEIDLKKVGEKSARLFVSQP